MHDGWKGVLASWDELPLQHTWDYDDSVQWVGCWETLDSLVPEPLEILHAAGENIFGKADVVLELSLDAPVFVPRWLRTDTVSSIGAASSIGSASSLGVGDVRAAGCVNSQALDSTYAREDAHLKLVMHKLTHLLHCKFGDAVSYLGKFETSRELCSIILDVYARSCYSRRLLVDCKWHSD